MTARPDAARRREMAFHGKSLTPGIARGRAFLLKRVDLERLVADTHTVGLISLELARIDYALSRSKAQISHLMLSGKDGDQDESRQIFEADSLLLKDPAFITSVRQTVEATSTNAESALAQEIVRLRDQAAVSSDEFITKSLTTMQDLYYRLLYNMLPAGESRISSILRIPAGSILVADRLTPVEVAVIPRNTVIGILIEEAAPNSHASIMARTLGVPVIADFPGLGSLLDESTEVLVDAYRGYAFLNPTEGTVRECHDAETRHRTAATLARHVGNESAVQSSDGATMRLSCNASSQADVLAAHDRGIPEIGLFRSEIRYLANTQLPSDEEETAYYAGIFGVEGMNSITVRLLDMGGDKLPVYMQMSQETDPQLGCRGIRFLLSHADLMRRQIRAILAARRTQPVRLLLPFVTTLLDLTQAREIVGEVLIEMGIADDPPHVGIMVEVPAVALSIERFLPKVDFVCLGTNDLMQYFFAANRDQEDLQRYNRCAHPAFLKMLDQVVSLCNAGGKHLTVCGEMASDPMGCRLLAALGARNLSIYSDAVHQVRHAISTTNIAALRVGLPSILDSDSADEAEEKMRALERQAT